MIDSIVLIILSISFSFLSSSITTKFGFILIVSNLKFLSSTLINFSNIVSFISSITVAKFFTSSISSIFLIKLINFEFLFFSSMSSIFFRELMINIDLLKVFFSLLIVPNFLIFDNIGLI